MTYFLIGFLGYLSFYMLNKRKKYNQDKVPSFDQVSYDIEKASYKWKQEAEDRKLEWSAKIEAQDMFRQWMDRRFKEIQWNNEHPAHPFNPYIGLGLYISPLRSCILYVYSGQKSKFDEPGSYQKLVSEEFNKLKEQYGKL